MDGRKLLTANVVTQLHLVEIGPADGTAVRPLDPRLEAFVVKVVPAG